MNQEKINEILAKSILCCRRATSTSAHWDDLTDQEMKVILEGASVTEQQQERKGAHARFYGVELNAKSGPEIPSGFDSYSIVIKNGESYVRFLRVPKKPKDGDSLDVKIESDWSTLLCGNNGSYVHGYQRYWLNKDESSYQFSYDEANNNWVLK